MSGINFATLIGHVGAEPEIRATRGGGKVATFSLATGETWKDKATGERKERTEWHRIVVFQEALVGVVEQYVGKGSKLYIRGTIRSREYTPDDGVKRYTTEIVLHGFTDQIVLLDRAESTRPPPAEDEAAYGRTSSRADSLQPQPGNSPIGGRSGEAQPPAPLSGLPDLDDEIPF